MYSSLVITTNSPKRFTVLKKTLQSIDENIKEGQKILSVDELPEFKTNKEFFKEIKGWEIHYGTGGTRNGMALNILRGLDKINNEWVFYCEDDVTFKKIIPYEIIQKLNKNNDLGFISGNAHIHDAPTGKLIEYIKNKDNYIKIKNFTLLVKNNDLFEKKWFFNFPSCHTKKEILKTLLEMCINDFKNKNISIEEGLSISWLNNFKELKSYIALINKPSTYTQQELHNLACMNYWNNDITTRIEPVNYKQSMWF